MAFLGTTNIATANCRVKLYSHGVDILCATQYVFRRDGWELTRRRGGAASPTEEEVAEAAYMAAEEAGKSLNDGVVPAADVYNIRRAVRRAKARVREISLCNEFRWFCTLTLSPERIDRYNECAVIRKLGIWLSNAAQRKGLKYVLVPERHKDGAIHFHGFLSDALSVVDSGTVKRPGHKKPTKPRSAAQRAAWLGEGGKVVYNLPEWTWGYSTAMELTGNYPAAVAYVCKYIGKDLSAGMPERIGGRWYYSGGNLAAPIVRYCDFDIDALRQLLPDGYGFRIGEAGIDYYGAYMGGDDNDPGRIQILETLCNGRGGYPFRDTPRQGGERGAAREDSGIYS